MTNPDLAALSKAATPGMWSHDFKEGEHSSGLIEVDDDFLFVTAGKDYGRWRDADDGGDAEFKSNGDFVTALVNEYRAGRLVQIDGGMRERVARGLYAFMRKRRPAAPHWNDLMGDTQAYYRDLADAVIAAMGGAK